MSRAVEVGDDLEPRAAIDLEGARWRSAVSPPGRELLEVDDAIVVAIRGIESEPLLVDGEALAELGEQFGELVDIYRAVAVAVVSREFLTKCLHFSVTSSWVHGHR
jgi:hypothetical protein